MHTSGEWEGCMYHWILKDIYYISSPYQAQEMQQFYLIHSNKHRETAKMRRQRNMAPNETTEQNSRKELNKMDTSNLLDAELKTLVIRMLSELRGRVDELRENFNITKEDMGTIKKDQSEMEDTLTEMKNNLQGISSRVHETENQTVICNIRKQNTPN